MNERRRLRLAKRLLPFRQAVHQFIRRRRNVRRIRQRAPGGADPVLCAAEFPGRRLVPANAAHEFLVKLANQPQGQRQLFQSLDAVFECGDVVTHLTQIFGASFNRRPGFRRKQLPERRLRALDAAGKHRLAADERTDENVGIRELCALAGQPGRSGRSASESTPNKLRRPCNRRRKRIGYKGGVSALAANRPAGGLGHVSLLSCRGENNRACYFRNHSKSQIRSQSPSTVTRLRPIQAGHRRRDCESHFPPRPGVVDYLSPRATPSWRQRCFRQRRDAAMAASPVCARCLRYRIAGSSVALHARTTWPCS